MPHGGSALQRWKAPTDRNVAPSFGAKFKQLSNLSFPSLPIYLQALARGRGEFQIEERDFAALP